MDGPHRYRDEWVPPLPSRDAALLEQLTASSADSWAARALRTLLDNVRADRHGVLINPIAVTDAWPEGDGALCVVYTPPLGSEPLVGVRRERGDTHPNPWLLRDQAPPAGYDVASGLATPDDPDDYALLLLDSISDSLGIFGSHLRYDAAGLGWWGTLKDQLPTLNRPGESGDSKSSCS